MFGNKSRNTHRGRYSGGISIYYKKNLEKCVKIIETNQNEIIWLELGKNLFSFDQNVYICCVYIPPNQSTVIDNVNFDFYDELEAGLERYKMKGKCFFLGDFNSRTCAESDVLNFDTYLNNDSYLSNNINIAPRASKDHVIDAYGRRMIGFCQSASLIIANGRLHTDHAVGEYTYHSVNGSSVVDYLLLNVTDIDYISHFCILQPNEFLDQA